MGASQCGGPYGGRDAEARLRPARRTTRGQRRTYAHRPRSRPGLLADARQRVQPIDLRKRWPPTSRRASCRTSVVPRTEAHHDAAQFVGGPQLPHGGPVAGAHPPVRPMGSRRGGMNAGWLIGPAAESAARTMRPRVGGAGARLVAATTRYRPGLLRRASMGFPMRHAGLLLVSPYRERATPRPFPRRGDASTTHECSRAVGHAPTHRYHAGCQLFATGSTKFGQSAATRIRSLPGSESSPEARRRRPARNVVGLPRRREPRAHRFGFLQTHRNGCC